MMHYNTELRVELCQNVNFLNALMHCINFLMHALMQ